MATPIHKHRGFEIVELDPGFAVVGLGASFGTLARARQAIDDHLDKPKEIPLVTDDEAAADSIEEGTSMPLPDPQPPRRSRVRH